MGFYYTITHSEIGVINARTNWTLSGGIQDNGKGFCMALGFGRQGIPPKKEDF
jgi:hypothetical protein